MALEARSDLFGERLNNSRHLWTSRKDFIWVSLQGVGEL